MTEEPIQVEVAGGTLTGHRAHAGRPALLLHGGPGFADYTRDLAVELAGLFATIRYTQRGVAPSTAGPPYSIESHVDDAIAVLDTVGVDRAWMVGHSWGAHLALHLLLAQPERVEGVVCIDPLGASGDVFPEFEENLTRPLPPEQAARVQEIEALMQAGRASEAEASEQLELIWPHYFADPSSAPEPIRDLGLRCNADTFASVAEHLERGTLARGLPGAATRALFVHGEQDPLPVRCSTETAALIPGAVVETIPDCGHFPWWERPGAVRDAAERFLARASG